MNSLYHFCIWDENIISIYRCNVFFCQYSEDLGDYIHYTYWKNRRNEIMKNWGGASDGYFGCACGEQGTCDNKGNY